MSYQLGEKPLTLRSFSMKMVFEKTGNLMTELTWLSWMLRNYDRAPKSKLWQAM